MSYDTVLLDFYFSLIKYSEVCFLKIRRILSVLLCVFVLLLSMGSCASKSDVKEPQTQARSFYEYFDTVSVIFSYKGDTQSEFEKNCAEVENILKEYHQLFDIYYEYADINNLKTINKNAGVSPVKVDRKLIDFLLYCKEIYEITNGETNIAMGSVLKLWHNARENAEYDPENARIPSPDELLLASGHTDIDSIIINEENSTVFISDPEVSIDVGAIGKGYATEMAAQHLIAKGVTSYVLNIGGNIRAIGEKVTKNGWITGITNPDKTSDEAFVCRVIIKDTSLVTSGDYERFYFVDGIKYHHIIDKDTNMPSKHFTSVSIIAEDSGLADALSTALFCMSYEDGVKLINKIGNVDVIWVFPDRTCKMTDGIVLSDD